MLVTRKRGNRHDQNRKFHFLDFSIVLIAGIDAKGQGQKEKRERKWDQGLILAPVASLVSMVKRDNGSKGRKREEV